MAKAELKKIFSGYSKFGNPRSDGKNITLSNSDKWLKAAAVIDGKKITTTDTGIEFKKFKVNSFDFSQFMQYIEALAKNKGVDSKDLLEKLVKAAVPDVSGTTQVVASGVINRLTDTTKYTGSHKERFDAEGKGKGAAGRTYATNDTGYVQGYKNKDTYGKK